MTGQTTPDVSGLWKSSDRGDTRYVWITRADHRYAYGFSCDAAGHTWRRQTRILLTADGIGVRGYHRPAAAA